MSTLSLRFRAPLLAFGCASIALPIVASCDLAFPLHESNADAGNASPDAGDAEADCGGSSHELCLECCQASHPNAAAQILAAEWPCVCARSTCTDKFTCASTDCGETPSPVTAGCAGCAITQEPCPPMNTSCGEENAGSCKDYIDCVEACPKLVHDS